MGDCRVSQCCLKAGNKCFQKNLHWASCNETCSSHRAWHGPHHHGHWKDTSHPVWDCTDLTTTGPTTTGPTVPPQVILSTSVSLPSASTFAWKIFEDHTETKVLMHTYPKEGDTTPLPAVSHESAAASMDDRTKWVSG